MSSAQGGPDAPPAALLCRLILTSACAEAGVGPAEAGGTFGSPIARTVPRQSIFVCHRSDVLGRL